MGKRGSYRREPKKKKQTNKNKWDDIEFHPVNNNNSYANSYRNRSNIQGQVNGKKKKHSIYSSYVTSPEDIFEVAREIFGESVHC